MTTDTYPELLKRIDNICETNTEQMIADRRDFHKYAEAGWTEFRTASLVARRLALLGFEVALGRQVLTEARMGLPDAETLEQHYQRALAQGADPEFVKALRGGYPAVMGTLRCGDGPTVGLRFDMDALGIVESADPGHRPAREGWASVNTGAAHACGHDSHTAIGLAVAEALSNLRSDLHGTYKLVFQPAEEGVRGAKSMVDAGVVDDVDIMLGLHVYSGWDVGDTVGGKSGFLATSKFDALIHGEPAHAGGSPQGGHNAMLAAANAVLNLYAIPRHGDGNTRINVGQLQAGTGRNVICPEAHLAIETRGTTSELNAYMVDQALRVLHNSAAMYGCTVDIKEMGAAQSGTSDAVLATRVEQVARTLGGFTIREPHGSGGSEDYTYMMRRVQEHGGLAVNIGLGANLGNWGHHTAEFDIDERALSLAVRLLTATAVDVTERGLG